MDKNEENIFQEIVEDLPEVFWKATPNFEKMLYVSPAYQTVWKASPARLYQNSWSWLDNIVPEDKERVGQIFESLTKDQSSVMVEYTIMLPDGKRRLINDRGFQIKNNKGEVTGLMGIAVDVTNLRMMDRQLLTQYSLNRVFSETPNMSEALILILRILVENLGWRMGIYWVLDKVSNKLQYFANWHDPAKGHLEFLEIEARRHSFGLGENIPGKIWQDLKVEWIPEIIKDNRFYDAEKLKTSGMQVMCGFPVYSKNEFFGVVNLFSDVSLKPDEDLFKMLLSVGQQIGDLIEQKNNEERIAYSAEHDVVTSLLNRRGLIQTLPQMIFDAKKTDSLLAILFLDLDHFKNINDDYGHEVGDEVLKAVGERLKNNLRSEDVVARLGGDEFVVVLTHSKEMNTIRTFVQKILSIFNEAFSVFGRHYRMTTSIGVSIFPDDGEETTILINMADAAMYQAKEAGRNTYQFCTGEMSEVAKDLSSMEEDLKHALERQEIMVYYQPIIETKTEKIVSVEALLRWNYKNSIVASDKFILLAEDLNLIVPFGKWALKNACEQIVAWQSEGYKLKLAVNISSRQMSDDTFLDAIEQILNETHLKGDVLDFEITERSLMTNSDAAIKFIFETKKLGINTILDDFGTGYTSLSYLKQFRIDKLKIDKSFIEGIPKDRGDCTIVHAIIALAHAMYASVVAEGVETKEQLNFLRKAACDEIQGYYYGRPVSALEMTQLLKKGLSSEK